MILKFSNELECTKDDCPKMNLDWEKCCKCLKMRRNMLKLSIRNDLDSDGHILAKSNSQKLLELAKKSKKDKKENKNEEIIKNQHDNIYNNLSSKNDNNKINIEKLNKKQSIENNTKGIEENFKNENKDILNLNLTEKRSDNKIHKNDELNLKDKISKDLNIKDNNKNEIKLNDSNKNNSISNNQIANFFGINNNIKLSPLNQLETFSVDSDNENSKNLKNKRNSFHSSSSFRKNFILKSDIYKNNKQKEINKRNNYSDNPIINYYGGKQYSKFTNFYMADIKSPEEIDDNRYLNFFPNKENNNSYSPFENIRADTIKESNDIFEDDNLEEKNKSDKLNLNNNDSLEKKFNLDFINNNSSSLVDDNSNNNIQLDNKNINNNIINAQNFNINNIENYNLNNNIDINNNNDLRFSLEQTKSINNSNTINFDLSNINKFNSINAFNNTNNQDTFNYSNNNNTNNIFNMRGMNNLNGIQLDTELLSEMSKLDLNKINFNIQGTNNYQMPNNYFIPSQNINDNSNRKFNYISYNDKEISLNGLPSGKSFYEYSEDDILKYAIPLIKDQSGCRFLQEKIKLDQSFMINRLFPSIQNNLFELGCDAFGNYFLQALMDIFSLENLELFLDLIKNFFTNMCINQHGTRVIQKTIEKVASNKNLVAKIENILNCNDLGIIIKSPYGNHIIQKYIISIHFKEYTKFIYDYILINFMEIAQTKHGVCAIQKCVSEGELDKRRKLYDLILQNFDKLINDEFGNYLIQYILINVKDKEKFYEVSPIIKRIEDNLIVLCKNKFSANVIEKCLENGDNFIKEYLLNCIINKYKDHIIELLLDKYGIYIIQKALKINQIYREKFYDLINAKKEELKEIDLNDFKYRGALKVLNSFKDFEPKKQNNNNDDNNRNYNNNNYSTNYNNFHNYNADYRNNYNNKRKNKRGRKNYRGK